MQCSVNVNVTRLFVLLLSFVYLLSAKKKNRKKRNIMQIKIIFFGAFSLIIISELPLITRWLCKTFIETVQDDTLHLASRALLGREGAGKYSLSRLFYWFKQLCKQENSSKQAPIEWMYIFWRPWTKWNFVFYTFLIFSCSLTGRKAAPNLLKTSFR